MSDPSTPTPPEETSSRKKAGAAKALLAPVRMEPMLYYLCPKCNAEVDVPARPKAVTLVCRKCETFFGAHPLPKDSLQAMRRAFEKGAASIPRVYESPEDALVFTLCAPVEMVSFSLALSLEALFKAYRNNPEATMRQVGAKRLLIIGQIFNLAFFEGFATANISTLDTISQGFFDFSLDTPGVNDLSSVDEYSLVAVQGVCKGPMGAHNPETLLFADSLLVGRDGREAASGEAFGEVIFDLPAGSKQNRSTDHIVFVNPPRG